MFGLWFHEVAGRHGQPHCEHVQMLVHIDGGDIERIDKSAGDWSASEDSAYHVLMLKKSNTIFMSVLFSTELNPVSVIC